MVVVVDRSFWLRVAEIDELIGKINFSSLLPQYLITAILTPPVQVAITAGPDILLDASTTSGTLPLVSSTIK